VWNSRQASGQRQTQCTLMKTLSRCCWVRKSHRTVRDISREAGGSIVHQFCGLFTKICISSAARKGALNSWLKRTACMRALLSVCSLRDDNVITSKPTWEVKHANSILEPFEYFYQISSKSICIISSYTVSKLGRFLRHSVIYASCI